MNWFVEVWEAVAYQIGTLGRALVFYVALPALLVALLLKLFFAV